MNKRDLLKKVYNLKNNIIVSGRINSRKTFGVMFPLVEVLMENNESFLVLDSKEEYLRRFYNELGDRGYDRVVVNLRDSLKSDGWNPLTYAYSLYSNNHIDEATRSIEKIAYILFDGQGDPYWTISAKNLFLGLVWFLFENAEEDEINFNSIVELLNIFKDKEYLFENYEEEECRSSMLLSSIIRTNDDIKNSIISIVRQSLSVYTNYPNLSKMLSTPMKGLHLDHKFAIFLVNRDEDLYFNALAAIYIDQFYDFLMKKRYDTPFNFILDNFETIASDYPNINILLSSGPSRKVRTIIGSNESIDYYDDYSETIKSSEENVVFKMDGEEYSVPNDYERVDLNQEVEYPSLKTKTVKVFNLCPCCQGGECTCKGECHCDDNCTCGPDCNCGCHEGKECTCGPECTCKNCTCDKKESFSDFIKDKEFDDIASDINLSELARKIDEEIARLNEELNDDIPDDEDEITRIIRKIDAEIALLEKQNKEDSTNVNNVRDSFNSFLNNNNFDELAESIRENDENNSDFDNFLNNANFDDLVESVNKQYDEEIKEDAFDKFLNSNNFNNLAKSVLESEEKDIDFSPVEIEKLTTKISQEIKKLDEELNDDIPDDEKEVQKQVNQIEGVISTLEDNSNDESVKKVRLDFKDFLDKNDFEEIVPVKRSEFDDLIKSIDEQIQKLENDAAVTNEKNDFERFLEDNDFDDIVLSIKNEEIDDNVTYDQLIEALDKEIAVLEEKINNENKENFDEIISKIDEEIARLEREEMMNPSISETRENYDEMISKIDNEIDRLEKEEAALNHNHADKTEEKNNKFDFFEIDRLNKDIDEELNKLMQANNSDDDDNSSHVIEIK